MTIRGMRRPQRNPPRTGWRWATNAMRHKNRAGRKRNDTLNACLVYRPLRCVSSNTAPYVDAALAASFRAPDHHYLSHTHMRMCMPLSDFAWMIMRIANHPYGIGQAWTWLARLNMAPKPATAAILQ